MPFDADTPPCKPRALLATRRFLRERREFTGSYPGFDAALREFVRFRVQAPPGKAFGSKDGVLRGDLGGLRRCHIVHGKAVLFYRLTPDALHMLAVVERTAYGTMRAAGLLRDQLASLGPDDLAPAPMLLGDPATEAAFEALRSEADASRAAHAEERAARVRAEQDAAAALDLAHSEQTRRMALEAETERLRGISAPLVETLPVEPILTRPRVRVRAGSAPCPVVSPPEPVPVAPEPFGTWLRRVRLERGLSQAEVAKMAGICSQATISYYERGKSEPIPEYGAAIKAALGTS